MPENLAVRAQDLENFVRLRASTARDIQSMFTSRQIEDAWALCSPQLAELCRIDDLTTAAVNPGDRRALFYLISAFRPMTVLEVGTNVGASTTHIVSALNVAHTESEMVPTLTTVDIEDVNDSPTAAWKLASLPFSPRERIEKLYGKTEVMFVTAPSVEFFSQNRETFDCIFLDGDHTEETVCRELIYSACALSEGGVIILHDFFPENRALWADGGSISGPFAGVERLRSMGAALDVLPLGPLPWRTKFNSHVTSLAVVTRA